MNEHALHVWREDTGLATTVAGFLSPAFADGHAILSIGTRAHVAAIEQRLRTDGHDVDGARWRGQYVAMDAERLIPKLLRNGLPTKETFDQIVGDPVARLARENGSVRAFGEIVSLLWRDGKRAAALRLEDLWNETLGFQPLSLICGYSERVLGGAPIDAITDLHDHRVEAVTEDVALRASLPTAAD